jgi:ATP-dependent DNA helicase RecG
MNGKALRDRIASGEDLITAFEAKLNTEAVGRSVCALLNMKGGAVLVGIDKNGRSVSAGDNPKEQAIQLELELKRKISPAPFLTTEVAELGDGAVIVVEVPQGTDGPYVFQGGVWLRDKNRNSAADIKQLRALFSSDREVERWERQLSPTMTGDDLDIDEIRATVRDAEASRRSIFSDPKDDRLVLKELSLTTSNGFTNAGDVLFSRHPGVRHPQSRVQMVAFEGEKSDPRYRDNRWFEGPLVRACMELISAVSAANSIVSTFEAGDARRLDRPTYDAFSIREGIVNAFVHRDYSAYSGGVRVSLFSDRIEIWNSGRLPGGLKPKDLRADHNSIPVNPDLAQVFHLRGLMEQIGRGTELIVRAAKDLGAPAPLWKDTETGVTLTLYASGGSEGQSLNTRQNAFLENVKLGHEIAFREYHFRFAPSVSDRQARRDLDELVRAGYLTKVGAGPSTSYKRRRS